MCKIVQYTMMRKAFLGQPDQAYDYLKGEQFD